MTTHIPPYFTQQKKTTCSLAILRMVCAFYGINISEEDLEKKVQQDYEKNFKNLWNPTIAKLACELGIETDMYAQWPLLKKENFPEAFKEYTINPLRMDIRKYENINDKDTLSEPLPIAYKDMFEAVRLGCGVHYGTLSHLKIKKFLEKGYLIQTSIKLNYLYPGKKQAYHSLLLFDFNEKLVMYHDPTFGKSLQTTFEKLEASMQNVGAAIVYKGLQ